jgi:hypothetical protein
MVDQGIIEPATPVLSVSQAGLTRGELCHLEGSWPPNCLRPRPTSACLVAVGLRDGRPLAGSV